MAFEGIYVSPQSSRTATPSQATGDFAQWKMRQTRESENHINQSVGELLCSLAKKQRHCLTTECSSRSHRQIDYQYSKVYNNHRWNHVQFTPLLCVQGIILRKHKKWTFALPFVWLSNVKDSNRRNENILCVSMANLIYSHRWHLYLNIARLFLIIHVTKIVNKMPRLATPQRIHPRDAEFAKTAEKQWRICNSLR